MTKKAKKMEQMELLRDWYKPTVRGRKARSILASEHPAWFKDAE